MPVTVGTAGHVDHGKTWLVRALTGRDTDRLPEERRRGLSIDLGYAPLELEDGRRLSLIDVPGHERFVRNMVAGASGIDLFLLVVDAGEGPRAQTHEHLKIIGLLGIDRGVVAVTKADTVSDERRQQAVREARELVPRAEVVVVSAVTGLGLEGLRAAIGRAADSMTHGDLELPTRLWIDRAFTIAGTGTVVTGTLWSGSVEVGETLRLEPAGRDVRIRAVEVHDAPVERAEAGQRVAVALPGVARGDLRRGDALVAPGAYPVGYRLDVVLEGDGVPAAVTAHLGSASTSARVVRSGNYAQLRLSEAVVASRGDRVVLRAETTVGGAIVLDPAPPRRLDPKRLERLEGGDPVSIASELTHEPQTADSLRARGVLAPAELEEGLRGLVHSDNWYFRPDWLEELKASVRARLEGRLESGTLDPGLATSELLPKRDWTAAVLPLLDIELRNGKAYLAGTGPTLSGRAEEAARLTAELERAGPSGVEVTDAELVRYLERQGSLVRLGGGRAISVGAYDAARKALVAECTQTGSIRLARFRDLLGISRKPAQLLLERIDSDGVTRRQGEARVLRRRARG
ncbi:MAG TPA: selenocysteine-specific translation elongation factor [Gaiellaceae bacterium]|nr:selenocysteine-specific translation elongation factor [Gaiellaceae bacterium]